MIDIVQGSDEWAQIRTGKATASRMADLTARTKSGWGASRANYMAELIAERLTGIPAPSYENDAIRWGKEKEPEARAAYEFYADAKVELIGFADHPLITMTGASPDGLVGDNGLVEIKCPNTSTHIDTLLGQSVPGKYISQIQWQLACTNRQWCDFVSFDPRMPESMRIFIRRIERDDTAIKQLEKDVRDFLAELEGKLFELRSLYEKAAAA